MSLAFFVRKLTPALPFLPIIFILGGIYLLANNSANPNQAESSKRLELVNRTSAFPPGQVQGASSTNLPSSGEAYGPAFPGKNTPLPSHTPSSTASPSPSEQPTPTPSASPTPAQSTTPSPMTTESATPTPSEAPTADPTASASADPNN